MKGKAKAVAIYAGEEHSQHVGQVYQEHCAMLRGYFMKHVGKGAEADALVRETVSRFFLFMEERDWESYAEDVPDYLMKIAGGVLFSESARGMLARRKNRPGVKGPGGLLRVLRVGVARSLQEGVRWGQSLLGWRPAGARRAVASTGY